MSNLSRTRQALQDYLNQPIMDTTVGKEIKRLQGSGMPQRFIDSLLRTWELKGWITRMEEL